jgi:hypothetical protein
MVLQDLTHKGLCIVDGSDLFGIDSRCCNISNIEKCSTPRVDVIE